MSQPTPNFNQIHLRNKIRAIAMRSLSPDAFQPYFDEWSANEPLAIAALILEISDTMATDFDRKEITAEGLDMVHSIDEIKATIQENAGRVFQGTVGDLLQNLTGRLGRHVIVETNNAYNLYLGWSRNKSSGSVSFPGSQEPAPGSSLQASNASVLLDPSIPGPDSLAPSSSTSQAVVSTASAALPVPAHPTGPAPGSIPPLSVVKAAPVNRAPSTRPVRSAPTSAVQPPLPTPVVNPTASMHPATSTSTLSRASHSSRVTFSPVSTSSTAHPALTQSSTKVSTNPALSAAIPQQAPTLPTAPTVLMPSIAHPAVSLPTQIAPIGSSVVNKPVAFAPNLAITSVPATTSFSPADDGMDVDLGSVQNQEEEVRPSGSPLNSPQEEREPRRMAKARSRAAPRTGSRGESRAGSRAGSRSESRSTPTAASKLATKTVSATSSRPATRSQGSSSTPCVQCRQSALVCTYVTQSDQCDACKARGQLCLEDIGPKKAVIPLPKTEIRSKKGQELPVKIEEPKEKGKGKVTKDTDSDHPPSTGTSLTIPKSFELIWAHFQQRCDRLESQLGEQALRISSLEQQLHPNTRPVTAAPQQDTTPFQMKNIFLRSGPREPMTSRVRNREDGPSRTDDSDPEVSQLPKRRKITKDLRANSRSSESSVHLLDSGAKSGYRLRPKTSAGNSTEEVSDAGNEESGDQNNEDDDIGDAGRRAESMEPDSPPASPYEEEEPKRV